MYWKVFRNMWKFINKGGSKIESSPITLISCWSFIYLANGPFRNWGKSFRDFLRKNTTKKLWFLKKKKKQSFYILSKMENSKFFFFHNWYFSWEISWPFLTKDWKLRGTLKMTWLFFVKRLTNSRNFMKWTIIFLIWNDGFYLDSNLQQEINAWWRRSASFRLPSI